MNSVGDNECPSAAQEERINKAVLVGFQSLPDYYTNSSACTPNDRASFRQSIKIAKEKDREHVLQVVEDRGMNEFPENLELPVNLGKKDIQPLLED